ncbi:MAG: hypothetical protein QGD94_06200 [Planctomycetia bacterium]|nr:hypothetical protein [Planctomycetia bacterium]
MDEIAFKEQLSELLNEVQRVPALDSGGLTDVYSSRTTVAAHSDMKNQMATLQDSLDYLRLSIRYLIFDLEATKRENRVLRQIFGGGEA